MVGVVEDLVRFREGASSEICVEAGGSGSLTLAVRTRHVAADFVSEMAGGITALARFDAGGTDSTREVEVRVLSSDRWPETDGDVGALLRFVAGSAGSVTGAT